MPQLQFTSREEMAWAAGLFDGEGTIGVRRNGPAARTRRIGLALGMTDRTVVERFASALGGIGRVYEPRVSSRYPLVKPVHVFAIHSFERTQATIAALWSWLSEPKRNQARRALVAWRQDPHRYHDETFARLCRRGHDLRNTRRVTPSGSRWCEACQPIRVREYRVRAAMKGGQ